MAEQKKRKCVVCGKEYRYCALCSKDADKPKWMVAFCSDACHDVYDILNKLGFDEITEDKAIEALQKVDLSDSEFPDEIQKKIEELLGKDKNTKESNRNSKNTKESKGIVANEKKKTSSTKNCGKVNS